MQAALPAEIAVVMTVRDEREFLRKNLLYHRFLGARQFYIYDDGSTDGTFDTVADLPYVTWRPCAHLSEVEVTPDLAEAANQHATYFVARQLINVQHAIGIARAAGFRWLVFIDADELLALDRSTAEADALAKLLGGLPGSVDAVAFPPLEAVQRRLSYDDVMTEETLFKIGKAGATRDTYDPVEKRTHRVDATYGHKAGKMAVRLDIESVPWSSHRFRVPGGKKLRTVEKGDLLHYYASDYESFVRKFRIMKDHPDQHVDGRTVVIQKRLWRDVVNKSGMSDDQLRDYYERWVMFNDEQLKNMRGSRSGLFGRKPALTEVTSAADALNSIEGEVAAEARLAE